MSPLRCWPTFTELVLESSWPAPEVRHPSFLRGRSISLATRDFGAPLHLLVVPGELHHIEAESLRTFADAPADLVAFD